MAQLELKRARPILVQYSRRLAIRRCLEKNPAERFQSAKDVAFALEAESGSPRSETEALGAGGVPASGRPCRDQYGTPLAWRVFGAEPRAGVSQVCRARVTPDGMGYACGYGEWLQDLYLVEGLRF